MNESESLSENPTREYILGMLFSLLFASFSHDTVQRLVLEIKTRSQDSNLSFFRKGSQQSEEIQKYHNPFRAASTTFTLLKVHYPKEPVSDDNFL
mmetsp:Transcript_21627/g.31979  ORF Transcript_21627/g.31979 Transcript_21627/m.31979 type:complete len:95 (-) Transcript_21627:318-602(-)